MCAEFKIIEEEIVGVNADLTEDELQLIEDVKTIIIEIIEDHLCNMYETERFKEQTDEVGKFINMIIKEIADCKIVNIF